jgi:Sigma-70, region 4
MTTRLAINLAQSARSRHETYIGTCLPEPVDTSNDPHLGAERGEALEFAVLLLLEKLSPTERAAYVLREAFDYSYQGIADVLKLTEANIRQLVSRARKHISDGRRATVSAAATDIVSYSDGGGVVRAARVPFFGRERVAKFIAAIASHFWTGVTLAWIQANGQLAVLISRNGEAVSLATINGTTQGINQIMWMMRPSKLTAVSHLSPRSREQKGPATVA